MVAFRYQAIGGDGGSQSGVIEAEDRRRALDQLSSRGLFPSRLEEVSTRGAAAAATAPPAAAATAPRAGEARATEPGGPRISRKAVTAFTRQMATLISATIPIPAALAGLAEQEESDALREVILHLADDVRRGEPFSAALGSFPRTFSPLYVSMVEVGEESGQLPTVLEDLADLLEEQDAVRGEVVSAVAYPVFVLVLGVLTTFVLLTFVMPKLLGILDGLTVDLPLPTRILLTVSETLDHYWLALLGVVVVVAVSIRQGLRTESGALQWDRLKLRLPALGNLTRTGALARFSRTLGVLHRSGVSLLRALEIVRNTVGNRYIAARIAEVAEETKGGDSLAGPIRKLGLFPPTMVQMIAVGEDTGRLDEMLLKVAAIQETQVRGHARTLISLLGPILIVIVGAVVGFIVISLLLPIFKINQGMS